MIILLTFKAAAAELGVPVKSLRRVAEQHGFVVNIGESKRLDAAQLPELIRKCQSAPKAPAYIGTIAEGNGSFETVADQKYQQAQQTVLKLKENLRNTSRTGTSQASGRVMPLR